MIKIERTIAVHRPVDEVFAYLDGVEHGPQYISGQREAHQTSHRADGDRHHVRNHGHISASRRQQRDHRVRAESAPGLENSVGRRGGEHDVAVLHRPARAPGSPSPRVSESAGVLRLAEPILAGMANSQVDHDLGALKELLAVTRQPTATAKSW